jgi:hypothetical protein
MRSRLALLVTILAFAPARSIAAQATARDSVVAVVQRTFDGMRTRDTTGLRALFDSTARLIGAPNTPTAPTHPSTVSQFLTAIATAPADRAWDERMFGPEVRTDGPVAQLWTYYTFREGATFSHCGTDAITLMRSGGAWRIVSWIWSVQRTGCPRTD